MSKWVVSTLWLLLVMPLLLMRWAAHGQAAPVFEEEVGYLGVSSEHVAWPAPESLVAELRSADSQVRLKALLLIGLTGEQAHHAVRAQASPTKVIGQKVATPDQVQLTYAALENNAAQQAIISLQDSDSQMTYAAVGVPTSKGWERAAAFDCWCKYEMKMPLRNLPPFSQRPSAARKIPSGMSLSSGQAAAGRESTPRTRRISGSRKASFGASLSLRQRIPFVPLCERMRVRETPVLPDRCP